MRVLTMDRDESGCSMYATIQSQALRPNAARGEPTGDRKQIAPAKVLAYFGLMDFIDIRAYDNFINVN